MRHKIYWVNRRSNRAKAKQAKLRRNKEGSQLMGNISCIFQGLWRPRGKDDVRESRSPTVDTITSADSGFSEPDPNEMQDSGFLGNVISALRDQLQWRRQVISKRSSASLPCRRIVPMTTDVLAADTGPEGGIRCLDVEQKQYYNYFHGSQPVSAEPIAGVHDWRMHHHKAFGLSQSLYDTDPETNHPYGEPNADAFAVVARENNAFLAVADGCGWGVNSFLAARIAVKGCIEYLSNNLHKASTTQEIIEMMLNSFKHAHESIIGTKGTITTLCAAVVCKLQDVSSYGLCVVNVGDSLAFVHRKDGCVQEVTIGSHGSGERDMRQAGGCIGPLVGDDPDLSNLTCSFTFVDEGDIVFLTTDGISDNFNPKVLKMKSSSDIDHCLAHVKPARSEETLLEEDENQAEISKEYITPRRDRSYSAPVIRETSKATPTDLSCVFMKKVIQSESPCGEESSARELCANLMNFVVQKTRERRTFLEENRNKKREEIEEKKKLLPGKLDHATVAAYEVGHFQPQPLKLTFQDKRQTKQRQQQSTGDQRKKNTSEQALEQNPEFMSEFMSLLSLIK